MAAGPQLKQFNANVVQLNTNILEVEHLTETAREVAGDVKDALGVFGDIEFAARETKNTLRDLSKTLGIMLEVGPLKCPFQKELSDFSGL